MTRNELARKIVHMAVGSIAFAVVFLGPLYSALCAAAALLMNLFVLPHVGGKNLWRDHETEAGRSLGIVFYPLAVLILILLFWNRLEVAAGIWGILAFGDGMASIIGKLAGGPRLPWNPGKSVAGSLAYVIFGGAGAATLLWWTLSHQKAFFEIEFLIAAAVATAIFAAFIESLPLGLDDNLSVPLVSALVLNGLLQGADFWCLVDPAAGAQSLLVALGLNLALAIPAYLARSVDLSGLVAGTLLGTTIFAALGAPGWSLLIAFFVLGTSATKLGFRKKAQAGLAQEKGGRRGARHALANTLAPALCALFAATTPEKGLYIAAFAGAFATATFDTLSSELGQLYGRRTFLITNLKPVPRGTEGAISLEGTLAGLAGALVVATLGWQVGLYELATLPVIVVAAFVGAMLESLIGATLEKRGLLDNEAVNFLNTLIGALVAAGLLILVSL